MGNNYLYGGTKRDDSAAMKAANQELLGLVTMSHAVKDLDLVNGDAKIRFPLFMLIDYR